jgi:HEAT repeat protein
MGSNQRLALSLSVAALALEPAFAESGGRLSADQFSLLAERLHASRSFKVRLQAALLLGVAGGADAEPLLVTALQRDSDGAVRAAAALALGESQDVRAFEPLVGVLVDEDPFFRAQVEKGLAELAQSVADGPLKLWEQVARLSEVSQERGLAVLGSLGAGGVPGLCIAASQGSDATKAVARAELSRLPADQLVAGLRATLRRKDADASPLAAAMLGDLGTPSSLPVLADALSDPTQPVAVQSEAHSALVRLSGMIDLALEAWHFGSDDPQERLRAVVLSAIKGGPPAEALALKALQDSNLRVQAAGAAALADLGSTQALPQIKALMKREDEAPIIRVLEIAARRLGGKQEE